MGELWRWYIELFKDKDNKVVIAAWSATITTIGFIITFLLRPFRYYLTQKSSQIFKPKNKISKKEEDNEGKKD
ncbi:MAG: hypothetical protein IPK46_22575 [Saprospiraceae bacterium]|nr:hypothetical protein [Saprospiraceae bacterium]